jgi:VCBS repeat-containing protein
MNNNPICFMRTTILKRLARAFGHAYFAPQSRGVTLLVASLLAAANLFASPAMTTLGGGDPHAKPKYLGYRDGDTLYSALFHTPCGIALDSTGQYLFVADRDNNAIRWLDLVADQTWTFAVTFTNLINKPIAVAVDGNNNVFVLNRGNGTNGSVVTFNNWGDAVITNAVRLTNATGMAVDKVGNIYLTIQSNKLIQIAASTTNRTIIASNFPAGTSLQGIVAKQNGLIAACDAGRNGIYLIDPVTGIVTTNAGFHGKGDFTTNGNNIASSTTAKFNQPMCVTEAGDGTLIVSDYGNNRIKAVLANGIVTNICGVTLKYWGGTYPGWYDATVKVPDSLVPNVQERMPNGVVFAPNGTIYVTEDYYHTIREVTGAGLPQPPPPPPQVPAPQIGWVSFPPPYGWSVFNAGTTNFSSWVFNNDVYIVIVGTEGSQIFYTYGATPTIGSIPDPTSASASAPGGYKDGLSYDEVYFYSVAQIMPDLTIKAIGEKFDGSPNSPIVQARFQFIAGNPLIIGNNAGLFTLADLTANAVFWYSIDGTDPTNAPGTTNYAHSMLLCTNNLWLTNSISLSISSNFTFKVRAFKNNYQPSAVVSAYFANSNFVPNTVSFGFFSGEASSDFVASPGQTFYAPVTFSPLPNTMVYSFQFNLTVTNGGPNPGPAIAPGAFNFTTMLRKPDPDHPGYFLPIPPYMFAAWDTDPIPPGQVIYYEGTNFVDLVTTNLSLNLLGVGWLERYSQTNLYDTKSQDLIAYSQAHDDLFLESGGKVILGGYAFQVPSAAMNGQTYQIRIGRPSATSDGVGAPGSSVFIYAPTNGSLGGGSVNSIKNVTMGQRKYIVGDVYPFRWFNAGDFGTGDLVVNGSSDVEQVFEAAIYGFNYPPSGSDLFDAMDSCGATYVDLGHGYLELNTFVTDTNLLSLFFDGNDTTINQIAFGDGQLDVCDVYVTYRRSLDPSLTWFRRFWTNGVRVAETTPNVAPQSVVESSSVVSKMIQLAGNTSVTNQPKVNFVAGDNQTTAGSTIQIPITANIFGNYPLRVLMLNLSVVPLDGSPALTTKIQFSPNPALDPAKNGQPDILSSIGNNNYAGAWLTNGPGLTGNATLGTLTVKIPSNATSLSAYAIHFDHASASPNGIGSFPKQARTGLITLSNRSGSSYNDGIPDSWRLRYFLTLNNYLSQTNADADGDGRNNLQEYLAGTDPTDPASFFKNIGTDPAAAQQKQDCVISWPSVSGKQYVILRSPSLSSPNWTPIATNSGNGTIMEFHDTSGGGVRFYRVRVQ